MGPGLGNQHYEVNGTQIFTRRYKMMYLLIVLNLSTQPSLFLFRDLEDCLTQKEFAVKNKKDAHCFRLDEPATTVKDLAQ